MELRCDCRSTNISETSRFEFSISYILRLMAISSTENAQCGVLPSTVPSTQAQVYAMLHCPRKFIQTILITSGMLLATGLAPALAADPTGDWRGVDGGAHNPGAHTNRSLWGAAPPGNEAAGPPTTTPPPPQNTTPPPSPPPP